MTAVERHYIKVMLSWAAVLAALYAFQQAFSL